MLMMAKDWAFPCHLQKVHFSGDMLPPVCLIWTGGHFLHLAALRYIGSGILFLNEGKNHTCNHAILMQIN